jgi:chromate transporter
MESRPGGQHPATTAPGPVRFGEALRWWLRLGFISFGGPAGQIAIMHDELVVRRRWISERRFLHALNYCMVLPGPEAQQLATYIGWLMHGVKGGIAAGALFVLPSLLILVALSWLYIAFGDAPVLIGLLYGIKPAIVAVVLHAAGRIGRRALRGAWAWGIAAAAFVAIFLFEAPFPAIIVGAGVLGALAGHRMAPAPAHGTASAAPHARALIDDDTPLPGHARFSRPRFAAQLAAGLGLWALVMGALFLAPGGEALVRMAWFFTTVALLTFGGAYAVLPFVVQAAVIQYGWLTTAQMMDGLALGETTPGPLIMVVAFVGFLAGWQQALLGPDLLFLAGTLAATVATFFTFLPSFLFILLGGPAVEATRHDLRFAAPLAGITAAVVGVIVNLALFFAGHVFWPAGLQGPFDGPAAVLTLLAAVALIRYDFGIIRAIALCGILGLGYSLLS